RSSSGYSRLADDLGISLATVDESSAPKLISAEAEEILRALQGKDKQSTSRRAQDMARILDMANCFDEQIEFGPFEAELLQAILQRALERKESSDRAIQFVLR